MKKLMAILLVMVTLCSLFAFAGCGKKSSETATPTATTPTRAPIVHPSGFEPNVSAKSEIIGTWKETEMVDGVYYEWTFFNDADMHRTKVFATEDIRRSSVGYYDYNDETGALSYYLISEGEDTTTSYTVKIDGKKMTFTPAEGKAITLEKVTG